MDLGNHTLNKERHRRATIRAKYFLALTQIGYTLTEIAADEKISKQRVAQVLNYLKRK